MKWLLTELAILVISVVVLVPMLIVIGVCAPFAAMWAMMFDRDLKEEIYRD